MRDLFVYTGVCVAMAAANAIALYLCIINL